MWLLENETLFGNKRALLKPGKEVLFGRTTKHPKKDSPAETLHYIDDGSVSRKHIVLAVLPSALEDGTKLHSRSQVKLTDYSKYGSIIDGKRIQKKDEEPSVTTILSGNEHTIQLGKWESVLKLTWKSVVFTYGSNKEAKAMKSRSIQLHALDIKTSTEFVHDKTTHVVSVKRNVPRVLQGLCAAVHIVTTTYLDAVIQAGETQNEDPQEYLASRLEYDFDENWPTESLYIPPPASEPVQRLPEQLIPDTSRSEVFSGLTFIFLDSAQHSNLQAPISSGGGKALYFEIQPGQTRIDDYVNYVKNVAGEKNRGSGGEERLPVITIRLTSYPDGMKEWAENFVLGVDRLLDQRSIQQNEFLDAIIMNDASTLQKPPSDEIEVTTGLPSDARTSSSISAQTLASISQSQPRSQEPATTQREMEHTAEPTAEPSPQTIPKKRPHRRPMTVSRFTGFDDYEPPPKSRRIEQDTPMEDIPESEPIAEFATDTQGRSVSTTNRNRKRASSPSDHEIDLEAEAEELFPAAAAIKRRRLATREASASVEPEGSATRKPKSEVAEAVERFQTAKRRAAAKEIDVREQTRARIKAEDDKRKEDEEKLREKLQGVDISDIRGLVQIEEMDVMPRSKRADKQQAQRSDTWDDSWNGRKNFKKFRRKGAERGIQAQKVIVTLEEVPQKKEFSFGEEYFLEESAPRSKKDEARLRRRQGKKAGEEDSDPEPGFTRRKRARQEQAQAAAAAAAPVVIVDDSNPEEEEVLPEEIASGSRSKRTQERAQETQRREEERVAETQTQTRRGKKPAMSIAGNPASTKRGRAGRREADSDEEETGFRRKRR